MPRTICKFCREPVYKDGRCEAHYESYLKKRAASAIQPRCRHCNKLMSLSESKKPVRLCDRCDPPQVERTLDPVVADPDRVRALREQRGLGINEAKRCNELEQLLIKTHDARSVEDLREIIHDMLTKQLRNYQ